MIDTTYSNRSASNISASVQKRRTLYLAASDPRVNSKETISRYANDYYAEVVILSDADYENLLRNQAGLQTLQTNDATVLSGVSLNPPTLLYWDYSNDQSATEFVTNSGSNEVNVVVTFDAGDSNLTGLTYEYIVNTTSTGVQSGSTASTSPVVTNVSTTFNSSGIHIAWKGNTNAVGYTVSVTGASLPMYFQGYIPQYMASVATNTLTKNYYMNFNPLINDPTLAFPGYMSLDQNGYTQISLVPSSGSFSGTYTFSVVANYSNSTSAQAKRQFTIGVPGVITILN